MSAVDLDSYRLGWLSAQEPAVKRLADAFSAYGDAFGVETTERQALKAAGSQMREALRIVEALSVMADADATEDNRYLAERRLEGTT